MHVLVIELGLSGHHLTYLTRIVCGLLERGDRVVVAIPEPDRDAAMNCIPEHLRKRLSVWPIRRQLVSRALDGSVGTVAREFKARELLGRVYKQVERTQPIDLVFLPYLDYCLYAMAILGSPFEEAKWSGVSMRPSFHHWKYLGGRRRPQDYLKELLFRRLLTRGKIGTVFTIDPFMVSHIGNGRTWFDRLRYFGDPVEVRGSLSKNEARTRLGIAHNRVVGLVYGSIDERKGIQQLLAAASLVQRPITLVFAGRQSEAVRTLLSSFNSPMVAISSIDRYVNDETEGWLFAAVDFTWLGYVGHKAMSGVLALSAAASIPVIACNQGLIGWLTTQEGVGVTVDVHARTEVATALTAMADRQICCKSENIFRNHTWSAALEVLLADA